MSSGMLVKKGLGYPDEMQARMMILEACEQAGSKSAFCRQIGISPRYLNLIMEWKRAPTHRALLKFFGWQAVYMTPEDLLELKLEGAPLPPPYQTDAAQRAYWRLKQTQSRQRRKLNDKIV